MSRREKYMGPKYFNVIPDYIPVLERCVAEKKWIYQQRKWWPPYDWADRYGVSWMGNDWKPVLRSPYELLQEGLSVVEAQAKAGADAEHISELQKKCNAFSDRIDEYYASGKDEKLIESIRSGIWVF